MSELEDRLRRIKEQLNKAKVAAVKMEQQLETAQESLFILMEKLQSEFEVHTVEEAQVKLKTMQGCLESLVISAEEKLNEAEGV